MNIINFKDQKNLKNYELFVFKLVYEPMKYSKFICLIRRFFYLSLFFHHFYSLCKTVLTAKIMKKLAEIKNEYIF